MAICVIDGCANRVKARGWCGKHYKRWRRNGDPLTAKWEWRAERGACDVCSSPVPPDSRTRRFCSESCIRMDHANGGKASPFANCNRCGSQIDRRPDGTRGWIRDDVLACRSCMHARRKGYGASVAELAARDGARCSLCDEPVDMALSREDSAMSASVDHVIPWSLGGSHDAGNLALAHLKCNQLKSNRTGWLAPA